MKNSVDNDVAQFTDIHTVVLSLYLVLITTKYSLPVICLLVSFRHFWMSPERFDHLLSLVGQLISKLATRFRNPISRIECFAVTLRYLATGDSQKSQSFDFRIGKSTVSNIIRETYYGICQALLEKYLTAPESTEDWLRIAEGFQDEWNFPHCIGAIDGKHICMECPRNGDSAFYNYKNFYSMVLMAVCDASYCFTMIDIGGFGRDNDEPILNESEFGQAFEKYQSELNIPSPKLVENLVLPYVLLGDDIFGLKTWLMKPYHGKCLLEDKRLYNYRHSRARRTIENSFEILSAKWMIFRRPRSAAVDTVEKIIRAAVCLHNYLRQTDTANYTSAGFVDSENGDGDIIPGNWRNTVQNEGSSLMD